MIRALTVVSTAGVLVVSCALGCKKSGAPPPPPDPMAVPRDVGDVRLAWSTSLAAPTDGFPVYVSRDFVFAGKPAKKLFAVPHGEDAWRGFAATYKRSGPHDLFLVPLAEASPEGAGHAVVYLDRETPYRLLIEVLFTLAQRSIPRFELATTPKDGLTRSVEVVAPKGCTPTGAQAKKMEEDMNAVLFALGSASAGPSASAAPPSRAPSAAPASSQKLPPCREDGLALTVLVAEDGIGIKGRGGNIAPGCKDVGAGLAISKSRSGTYDFEGLTRCVDYVKHLAPQGVAEDELTITAYPFTTFATIVATIDATRTTAEGGVLFPKVKFGLPR